MIDRSHIPEPNRDVAWKSYSETVGKEETAKKESPKEEAAKEENSSEDKKEEA